MRSFLIFSSILSFIFLSSCTGGQSTDTITPNPPPLSLNINGQDVTKSIVNKTGLVDFQLSNLQLNNNFDRINTTISAWIIKKGTY